MKKFTSFVPIILLISYISFVYYSRAATVADVGVVLALATLYGFNMWIALKRDQIRTVPTNPELEKLEIELLKTNLEREQLVKHKEMNMITAQIKSQEDRNGQPEYKF